MNTVTYAALMVGYLLACPALIFLGLAAGEWIQSKLPRSWQDDR